MAALAYPNPTDLKAIELMTLSVIQKMGCLKKDFADLVSAAQMKYQNLDPKRGGFDFSTSFEVDSDKTKRRVDIGALIEVDGRNQYERVSYFFSIGCPAAAKDNILRKIHFDFEAPEKRNLSECKPSIHMQVGGKLTPSMATAGYTSQHLDNHFPWFEKPRVPSLPFSLALLLDWLFLEFLNTPEVNQVVNDGQWRSLVLNVENTLLKPYFEGCNKFFQNPKRPELFFANYCYGLKA
jgi:hypothetical protein